MFGDEQQHEWKNERGSDGEKARGLVRENLKKKRDRRLAKEV
jgi:hypothetical protein